MTQVIWVDSRQRTSGTHSNFEVALRESVHLSDARVRVDKLTFADSFYTTDLGANLYFADGSNSFSYVSVPEGAYTRFSLAQAIKDATGRDCVYNVLTNTLVHVLQSSDRPWLSDADVALRTGTFPLGASASNVRSLNEVLGEGTVSGIFVTWPWIRVAPYDVLYLRSNRLRCENHHGMRGDHDILCSIPLTQGVGSQIEAQTPTNVYYNLAGGSSCRTMDFRLTDALGRDVNLRGRALNFQLTFE